MRIKARDSKTKMNQMKKLIHIWLIILMQNKYWPTPLQKHFWWRNVAKEQILFSKAIANKRTEIIINKQTVRFKLIEVRSTKNNWSRVKANEFEVNWQLAPEWHDGHKQMKSVGLSRSPFKQRPPARH